MEEHTKKYHNKSDFQEAYNAMGNFQKIHNIIRDDYLELLKITENSKGNQVEFDSLYRASLKSLFSLIEADIYGLNLLESYDNYSDKDRFEDKMKKTFKQISETWNKSEIKKEYFDTKFSKLKKIRKKRNELVHPKEIEHIHSASEENYKELKEVFEDYDFFINKLMDKFFIGINIDASEFLGL